MTKEIEDTLAQRGKRYGDYTDHSRVTMLLCDVVRRDPASGYNSMSYDKRLAVDVILNKIARICTGDPEYDDNWHDIIGYATLVEARLVHDEVVEEPQASPFAYPHRRR